ncbi:MAG: hypothetical protein ACRCT8_02700 [Lacipirellulaceae bacterium]
MDAFRFAVAVVPLGAYLLVLGLVNLRRKPMVVAGSSDLAALGAAATGLAIVGPIALFRPEEATAQMGSAVWLFLIPFYWLWVALAVMLCRPRLVVYNATPSELRPLLAEAAGRLDPDARWAGDNLSLPALGVQLHLDSFAWMRNTSLVASGGGQNLAGWRRLTNALGRSCRGIATPANPRGPVLVVVGAALLLGAIVWLVSSPTEVAVAWAQATSF